MTSQFRPAVYKNVRSECDPVSACPRLSGRVLTLRDGVRKRGFVKGVPALVATIVIALFFTSSAIARERQHVYSEYTYWFGGAFENGHAFLSSVAARNYQLESRYERLIYWSGPFAVRWVFDGVPMALIGDRYTSTGRRTYSYGITAQFGGGVQLFTSIRRTAIDLGYKYHPISNANLGNQNPELDSHMLFVGLSLFR
jgi:hypothetical protein